MEDDLFDEQNPYAAPPTHAPSGPSAVCPSCGVGLQGVRIGEACPTCGVTIGSRASLNNNLPPSGKATASLVLGIVSIPVCFLYGIPAIVCAILALVFAKQARVLIEGGHFSPASLPNANAGRICGIIGLSLGLLYVVIIGGVIIFSIVAANNAPSSSPTYYNAPSNQPVTPTPSPTPPTPNRP